ncbi:MAG TPA: DNA mismatch repair protein MutS [bacterium]|nr:DNA mismatch repair protein MutS [bacterium]
MDSDLTPMMQQYHQLKARFPGMLLMFRLGDFYELFYDDAQVASRELEITLTSRETGKGRRVPMCGVPYHALNTYLSRLVERGYRVAVCDQLEDPRRAKGLVKRDVVRIVTPGTVVEHAMLPADANNYLMAVAPKAGAWGLAVADLSTGEFAVTELRGEQRDAQLTEELARWSPAEVLIPETSTTDLKAHLGGARITTVDEWRFDPAIARGLLLEHFGVATLDGFGCEDLPMAVAAAGALLHYLKDTQFSPLAHMRRLVTYSPEEVLALDSATSRNLELVANLRDGGTAGTLFEVLNDTKSRMGARKLRHWLLQPLVDPQQIVARHDGVEYFVGHARDQEAIHEALHRMPDLERLTGRVGHGSADARDLVAVAAALDRIPEIQTILQRTGDQHLLQLAVSIDPHDEVKTLVTRAIVESPPLSVHEGGVIRDGYNEELDQLRAGAREGKAWIASLETQERARTRIRSLKVGFNRVFGYYLEVSKANLHLVPADYVRKQTLAGVERYVTEAMKEREAAILGAEERIAELEYALFSDVRDRVAQSSDTLLLTAAALAETDVLASLASVAARWEYVRPVITGDLVLEVTAGRHPVVERLRESERFVPNDIALSAEDRTILVVTGPNMAGKSTYLRQAALITLMAQMGSFVPAAAATVGIADRIFTRVGAIDDIATGRSTFLVEMQEVANILHHATKRSLVILDEVGRGTSTYDGMSLAWAVVDYLHDRIGPRTLFATHYHELTELAALLPRVRNVNVLVKEEGDRVVFIRKVVDGGADRSYGIHVARLAGLPPAVIEHAQRILRQLEATSSSVRSVEEGFLPPIPSRATGALQLPLPLAPISLLEEQILGLSLESLTPLEALNALHTLREQVRQRVEETRSAALPGKIVRMKRHRKNPN